LKPLKSDEMMQREITKILVIRFSSLGDLVLLTPLFGTLRSWNPGAEIHLVTKERYAPLFATDGRIDEMKLLRHGTMRELLDLRSELRAERYDLIIDAHNVIRSNLLYSTIRSGVKVQLKKDQFKKFMLTRIGLNLYDEILHQSERYLELLRPFPVPPGDAYPSLAVPDDARDRVRSMIGDHGFAGRPLAALAPGARWETKRWPVEHYASVADSLASSGYGIVLVGGSDDETLCMELSKLLGEAPFDASGKLDLLESAALLSECLLLVTNDSAPLHMAEAVGTPVVAIFGPTVRELGYFPQLPSSVMLGLELSCRPCSRNGARPCHLRTRECLVDLDPGHVIEAAGTVLGVPREAAKDDPGETRQDESEVT
jgi:heptosyltransferase-2